MKRIFKSKRFWVALLVPYGIIIVSIHFIAEKIKKIRDKKNKK